MSSDITEKKSHSSITVVQQSQHSTKIPILEKEDITQKKDKKPSPPEPKKVSIVQLFRFSTPRERILIAIAILLSITAGFLNPFTIVLYGNFISGITDPSLKANLLQHVTPIILDITYTAIGVLVSTFVSNQLWIRTGENQAHRIRQLYLRSILHQDMSWFDMQKDDSLTSRLTEDTQAIQEGISEKTGLCITYLTQFITALVISFWKGYQMALIILGLVPIVFITVFSSVVLVKKYMWQILNASAEANSVAEQAFRSIRTVHAFSLQKRFVNLFEKKSENTRNLWLKRGLASALTPAVYMVFFFGFTGLSLWYGSQLLVQHKLDTSSIYVIFIQMAMGNVAMSKLLATMWNIATACGAAAKVFQVIDQAPHTHAKGHTLDVVQGNIEFKNVYFTYPSRLDSTVLQHVSFTVKPGMTVAFVGASGSGKSTVIQLLQRFYEPDSGSITLDGHELNSLNVNWLRQTMGIVGQQPVLFNTTIRANLALGSDRHVTEEEMIRACEEANCHQFIRQLPQGYNTVVGDNGAMLSGGQKQRIAIARAIIKNPSILLLDEATSALDTKSERIVQRALDKASASRTTIVIAHRLSTIANADRIFVVDQGRIIEQGTHQTLIALNGLYTQLVNKQKIDMMEDEIQTSKADEDLVDDDMSSIHGQQHCRMMPILTNSTGISDKTFMSHKFVSEEKSVLIAQPPTGVSSWEILKEMKPEWKMLGLGTLGSILVGGVMPYYSYFFSLIIGILGTSTPEEIADAKPFESVNLVAFIVSLGSIFSFAGYMLGDYYFFASAHRFAHRLRVRLFESYLKQEIAFFDAEENNTGILIAKLTSNANSVGVMVSEVWGKIIAVIASGAIGIALACTFSWQITLIILGLAPFILLAAFSEMYLLRKYESKNKEALHQSSKLANEIIREVRTVVSLNKQTYFEQLYVDALDAPHSLVIRKSNVSSIGMALNRSSLMVTRAIVFVVGAVLIMHDKINFEQFFGSMTVLLICIETMSDKVMVGPIVVQGKTAASSIFNTLQRRPTIDMDLEGSEKTICGDVNLDQIQFAYPTRPERPVFKGKFQMSVSAGQSVALVGASGSGKSTVIGLLLRWYDAQKGSVQVDHTNVRNYSLKHLRQYMAVVSQEPILFDVSIEENIRFGSETEVNQQAIEDVCRAANIHRFIMGLPEGYATRVGDKGSQLSGGQRQRIAIARALIRNPKILLLDEATSALDSESEHLVQEALDHIIEKGGRTTITIAHRLSTITRSDLICVVDKGEVIEQGTHQQLMAQDGVYAKLVYEQSLEK